MTDKTFTPAAGRFAPSSVYDLGVAVLTREAVWRPKLAEILALAPGDRVLDVGCGTGSLALLLKQHHPDVEIVGLDPDPASLSIARAKASAAGVDAEWRQGFASDAADAGMFDKVVSSLVFHQVPVAGKRAGIEAMFAATKAGGAVCIADYAQQSRRLMRTAFHFIQLIDGKSDTQPNADGFLETELSKHSGKPTKPVFAVDTPTGTISIFREMKAVPAVEDQG
jgi:ubiquinone/menaquinone biosynthesis C-methylase UbiE